MIVKGALADLRAGLGDGIGKLSVEETEIGVRLRGGLLHGSERSDELAAGADIAARDGEVFDGAQAVYAPISLFRDLAITDEVMLYSSHSVLKGFLLARQL